MVRAHVCSAPARAILPASRTRKACNGEPMATASAPTKTASEILTERSDGVLSIQLNRPTKKNAMTSSMYITMANQLDEAARDQSVRVILWHGAGDSFSAGNDIADFLSNSPGPGES